MTITYRRLIRDKIPKIIEVSGEACAAERRF